MQVEVRGKKLMKRHGDLLHNLMDKTCLWCHEPLIHDEGHQGFTLHVCGNGEHTVCKRRAISAYIAATQRVQNAMREINRTGILPDRSDIHTLMSDLQMTRNKHMSNERCLACNGEYVQEYVEIQGTGWMEEDIHKNVERVKSKRAVSASFRCVHADVLDSFDDLECDIRKAEMMIQSK